MRSRSARRSSRSQRAIIAVASVLCLLSCAAAPAFATHGPVAASVPSFASPPQSDRSLSWNGDGTDAQTTSGRLDALAAAGFGGADLRYSASEAGRSTLTAVLDHAARTRVAVHLDPCGNTACDSSAVTLATGMQQLVTRNMEVTARADDTDYDEPLAPADMPGDAVLIAVSAAKVTGSSGGQILLDPDTAVDLTSNVGSDRVKWTIPTAGTWRVFAFYSRATGQYVSANPFESPDVWTARDPSIGAASGHLVADIFSSQGLTDSLDLMASSVFGDGNGARLAAQGATIFHDSLELQARAFWTRDLPEQFRARRGYSMIKYLPALDPVEASSFNPLNPANARPLPAPPFDFAGGIGERFRNDYHRTLSDLYAERYVKAMTDWAHEHGLKSRVQPSYNYAALDVVRAAAQADVPESETFDFAWGKHAFDNTLPAYPADRWRYSVDSHRLIGSGAHIASRPRVTTEYADDFATYSKGPLELASLFNSAVVGGVTMPVFAPFGGVEESVYPSPCGLCFIGLGGQMTPNMPQWKDLAALNTYFARTTQVVEAGKPRVDVTIYHDRGLSSLHDEDVPLWRGQQLARSGYTYDFVDPVDLAGSEADSRPGRLFGDGPNYRALIIDDRESLDPQAALATRRAAQQGLPVVIVGSVPSRSDGLHAAAANDALVRWAMAAVLARPNTAHVATEDDVPRALAALGVDPSARFTGVGTSLQTVHRRTAGDDLWWVFNPTDALITTTGSFAATGTPYGLDLWNGTTKLIAQYTRRRARTAIPVTVPAHGTIAYLIHRGAAGLHVTSTTADRALLDPHGRIAVESATGGSHTVMLSNGKTLRIALGSAPTPVQISGWHLSVDEITPAGHINHDLDLTELRDWRDIPEIEGAVGSAVYSADINVPAAWLAAHRDVRLDLGAFAGAVRTFVNGTLTTAQTTPGGDHAIGALLHRGVNHLVVKLDTTVNNRNAQLAASGNGAYATGPTPFGPLPSGLLGPVKLTPVAVRAVDTQSRHGGASGSGGSSSRR